jgi:hypothetical protein
MAGFAGDRVVRIVALSGGGIGLACLALAAVPADWPGSALRAWLLFAGFLLLLAALAVPPRRAFAPLAIAGVFVVYGGISAVLATPGSEVGAVGSSAFDVTVTEKSFAYATMITALAGAVAIGASLLAAGRAGVRETEVSAGRLERAGKTLVLVGFAGIACALARFGLTQLPVTDLWASVKSFWVGGSYFLLLAIFAVPGLGLWLQGVMAAGSPRRELLRFGAAMSLYLVVLVPTGQRVFATALAVMVLAVLVSRGRVSRRAISVLAVLGVVLVGLTQAVRNQTAETGTVKVDDYLARIAPSEWDTLYGSQLTSFRWAAVIDHNRDRLEIPNPFPRTLLKPVPRQLYPEKSQGFGAEFTSRVFPEIYANQVSYATPLTSEADYAFGPLGVLAIFLALGGLAGLAERRVVRPAPRLVQPILLATLAWCAFTLVRGDLANALMVSAGWVVPLVLVSGSIGLRRERAGERKRERGSTNRRLRTA